VLMDAACTVLTVNQAARTLTSELTDGQRTDGNVLSVFFDRTAEHAFMEETISRG